MDLSGSLVLSDCANALYIAFPSGLAELPRLWTIHMRPLPLHVASQLHPLQLSKHVLLGLTSDWT